MNVHEDDHPHCPEDVWDGPYRMTCGRLLIDGVCGRHGRVVVDPLNEIKEPRR